VAGFRQWQAKGRQVRKGERSIKIYGFSVKKADPDAPEGQPQVRPFFPILSVFDISQTDVIPGEVDPTAITKPITGDDDGDILGAVEAWLTGLGWTMEREALSGGKEGFTTTDGSKRVVVDSELSGAAAAATALHEVAHVILHSEEPGLSLIHI